MYRLRTEYVENIHQLVVVSEKLTAAIKYLNLIHQHIITHYTAASITIIVVIIKKELTTVTLHEVAGHCT